MASKSDEPVDFVITFTERGDDYIVRLEEQDAGEARKPILWKDLEAVASESERLLKAGEDHSELAVIGKRLFGLLLEDADRDLFVRASGTARREGRPLRILIKLSHGSPLQTVPWELLHDSQRFLAKDPRCAVVRYFDHRQEVLPFQVDPPLRILLTSACPPPQPDLNLGAEVKAVQKAYEGAKKLVCVKVERDVSLDRLENLWRGAEAKKHPFHVWHHCGHGHLTESGGEPRFYLSLERRGQAEYVSTDQLSEIIGMCPDLKLALLNVCHGGSFVGLAPELARINVPVVIGFPGRLANNVAHRFAAILHQCILQVPVEFAVSQARRALCIQREMDLEWSKPLLISRRSDCGPILRLPVRKSEADHIKRRSPGVTINAEDIEARGDVRIVGVEDMRGGSSNHKDYGPIRLKQSGIRADSFESIGLKIGGFSEEGLHLRERQMQKLIEDLSNAPVGDDYES